MKGKFLLEKNDLLPQKPTPMPVQFILLGSIPQVRFLTTQYLSSSVDIDTVVDSP